MTTNPDLHIAYISQGKLYLKFKNAAIEEVESEFGQTLQNRLLQTRQKKAWKNKGIMEMMMPPGAMERMQNQPEPTLPVFITSMCQGAVGKGLYALEAGEVGGIFSVDLSSDLIPNGEKRKENRLFHNSNFRVSHLDFNPEQNLIACTTVYPTGIANIATMDINSSRPTDVTEGDSLDLAPRWIPHKSKAIVYQSAGLGRVEDGYIGDRTPFRVEKLDFITQEISTLASDPKSDLLSPQIGYDGLLYYIRRPFGDRRSQFNPLNLLKELLLIPVRLIYAIFQWLNYFSQMYTGKPLMSAGTNQKMEPKQIKAFGEWITPNMLKDKNFADAEAPPLVPTTWQLCRQGEQGTPEMLAEGVLSYDLAANGAIAYTNGTGIYMIYPGGERERILIDNLVESVSVFS